MRVTCDESRVFGGFNTEAAFPKIRRYSRNETMRIRTTALILNVLLVLVQKRNVDAFTATVARVKTTTAPTRYWSAQPTTARHCKTAPLYSNSNNNDNEEPNWIAKRLERASLREIRRDAVLIACFVLCRFFIYDIETGIKTVPGWELQDVVYLTGTVSSAVVLVTYWTIAGLLSRRFENAGFNPIQTLVNVALSCPIWLATEHLLEFGPPDIGGPTLASAVLTGFLSMSSAMLLGRAVTSMWE